MSRTQQRSQAAVQPGPPGPPTRPRGPAYFRSAPHFCLAAAFKGILFDGWYPGAAAKLTPLNHLPHFQATAREVFRGGEADPKSKAKFRSSGEGNGNPLPVLLPGKLHGWSSLVGYSPWGCKESDTTERLHFHFLGRNFSFSSGCLLSVF